LNDEIWKQVSADAKDLISKLLTKDFNKRLSATDALQHIWFKKSERR
jgi:serine/threonine protein kinase